MESNRNSNKTSGSEFFKSYGKYIAVIGLALVLILIIVFAGKGKGEPEETSSQMATDVIGLPETETTPPEENNALRENDIPEIDTLINTYYTASHNEDFETLSNIVEGEIPQERIQWDNQFIEDYQNIRCYVKDGLVEGTYFVIAYYEAKVYNVDTPAPSLNWMYVCTNEDGSLYINIGNVDGEVAAYIEEIQKSDEVNELAEQVDTALSAAMEKDEKLAQFVQKMVEGADPTVVPETEEETEATTEAPAESGEDSQPEEGESGNSESGGTVYATKTVNIRKTPSTDGEIAGKLLGGSSIERISVDGEWTKVKYHDEECYVASEYLSEDQPVDTSFESRDEKVTALQGVKMRKEPSTSSEELGVLAGGTEVRRTGYNSEWSRIVYDGQTCYVASEYLR